MKKTKTLLLPGIIALLALFSLCSFGQTFSTTYMNIELEVRDLIKPATKIELTHAVKYRNEFYCFFSVDTKYSSRIEGKFCFVFSPGDTTLKKIEVPDEIQDAYYFDLFVENDRLLVKTYRDSQTFYFDHTNSKWVKTGNAKDLIFEDEKYYVYSLDFGEWGGKTWFKDKETNLEYLIELKPSLINKIGGAYYLTGSYSVLKIENPENLNKCSDDVTYEHIHEDAKYARWYGKQIGFEIIYIDTLARKQFYDLSYKPRIVTSFIFKEELVLIYETAAATYIAKCGGNSIQPIQKIGEKFRFYNWYYSYRNKIQPTGQQLLKFEANGNFGLLEINSQDIKIYKLVMQ